MLNISAQVLRYRQFFIFLIFYCGHCGFGCISVSVLSLRFVFIYEFIFFIMFENIKVNSTDISIYK